MLLERQSNAGGQERCRAQCECGSYRGNWKYGLDAPAQAFIGYRRHRQEVHGDLIVLNPFTLTESSSR